MSRDLNVKKSTAIAIATLRGWEVTAEGEWGIQLIKRRKMRKIFVLVGFILLVLWGLGIFVWLWGYFEYLCSSDHVVFVSDEDLLAGHFLDRINRAETSK